MTVGQRRIIAVIHFTIHFLLNIRTMLLNPTYVIRKNCVFGVLITIMKTLSRGMYEHTTYKNLRR